MRSQGPNSLAAAIGIAVLLAAAARSPAWATQSATPAPGAVQTFNIYEFRVLGSHVLGRSKVEAAVYPFLGPDRTLQTVEQARAALVAAYRGAGYGTVLVDIPVQTVDQGVVRLQVTEGRIDGVHISGARYYSEGRILSELPSLKPGAVPRFPALQAQLARLANEAPDRQITPLLVPGSKPGTVSVDLKVKDRIPVHASLQVDNRYTSDTAHIRLTGMVSYDNLFQDYQTLSLQYQTSPADPSEVKLWVLNYQGRTAAPDWTWSVYGIRSDSNVAAIGTLAVIGNGKIIGGRLTGSLLSEPGRIANVTFGVDYKDFGQDIVESSALSSATPIHYFLWSAQLAGTRIEKNLALSGAVGVNFGMRGIGSSDAEFEYKRYEATGSYAYLHGNGNVFWRFWHGLEMGGKLSFQYSEQPLINNEQFSLGGMDTVRGYLEAEELVDSGIAGSVELHSPRLGRGASQLYGYLYYDRGIGMNQDPLTSEITSGLVREDLASYGFGLHLSALHGLDADVLWAIPRLTAGRTRRGDGRVDFSVLYGF